MTAYRRIESVIEPLAKWALDYRSVEHHDSDHVATIGGIHITIGHLRQAFECHFGMTFDYYLKRLRERHTLPAAGEAA